VHKRHKIKFVYVYLALLLILVIGVFVYSFLRPSDEPSGEAHGVNDGTSLNLSTDESPDYDDYYDQEEPIEEPPSYILLNMNPFDVFTGYLILVNHTYAFDPPQDTGLASLLVESTGAYNVLGANHYFRRSLIPTLDAMMAAYTEETGGTRVAIISAYRGMAAQQSVLDDHVNRLGYEEARRWVALPGHSEHHTGLAIDLGIYSDGYRSTFTGTGVTAWFRENAHRFGFILRFPYNSFETTLTAYEPWHFRYIGTPHSHIVFQNELLLEDYIEYLRGYTVDDPLVFELDGNVYEIFFTDELEIRLPLGSVYEVSGNNVDGFIVTLVST